MKKQVNWYAVLAALGCVAALAVAFLYPEGELDQVVALVGCALVAAVLALLA